jgi:uncharacterized delta-60 repeat protein
MASQSRRIETNENVPAGCVDCEFCFILQHVQSGRRKRTHKAHSLDENRLKERAKEMQTSTRHAWVRIRNIWIAGLLVQASCIAARGADIYVSPTGNDTTGTGSISAPYQTIQKAAFVVLPGDTVIVRDGVYSTNPYVDNPNKWGLVVIQRGGSSSGWVTFKSENKGGAVLDGNNTFKWGFHLEPLVPGETPGPSYIRIQDFKIRNIYGTGQPGGTEGATGIDLGWPGSNYEITGNHIHDIGRRCSDSDGFFGMYLHNLNSVVVQKNVIHDIGRFSPGNGCNPSTTRYENRDHGIYVDGITGITIKNNIIYNIGHGWGVQFFSGAGTRSSGILVANNTFAFQNPYRDGHIVLGEPGIDNANIQNNIFYIPRTAGVRIDTDPPLPTFSNVIVTKNLIHQGVINSGSGTGVTFSDNLENTNPLLLNPNPDPSLALFQLQSGSPARDAGVALTEVMGDFDGSSRPYGLTWDIGAYEYYPPGVIDLSFNPGIGPNGTVLAHIVQPNGRIVIGGSFSQVNGVVRNNIARLNSDGSLDLGFTTSLNAAVEALALQSDGKIIVGGSFTQVNGQPHNSLVRLNADGTKDSSMNPEEPPDTVFDVGLHPDGKIIAVGYSATWDEALQYGPDGSLYGSIAADSIVRTVAIEATGDILIGGDFQYLTDDFGNTRTRWHIARIRPDGFYIDPDFEPFVEGGLYDIQVQTDGRILLAGPFSAVNGIPRSSMARLVGDAYGTLDSFAPTPNDTVYSVAYRSDGKIYIGGAFTTVSGTTRNRIARLNANGTLDTVFDPGTGLQGPPPSIATTVGQQADGKVIVGGSFTSYNGTTRNRIVRIHGN